MSAAVDDATRAPNPFLYFWQLGYRSLIPVIPPGVEVDERSFMAAREGDHIGKAPGIKWSSGRWGGFKNWQRHEATPEDLEAWGAIGASVGLRLGDDGHAAIDIDASDPATAEKIENLALSILGFSPCRVGRAPRRALFYKLPHAIPYRAVVFEGPNGPEKVEIASEGRQIVVQGIHPKTGKLYEWPRRPVPAEDLTAITLEQLDAFMAAVRSALPAAVEVSENVATERASVDQTRLRGNPALVREAIEALPNSRELYPTREDYIRVGVALKAALPNEEEAFDLWRDWAAKDDGGVPGLWAKDWKGIKPPFEIGANWLYDEATRVGGWDGRARVIADQFGDPEAFAAAQNSEAPLSGEILPNLFDVLSIESLFSRPDPEFLIDRHIPEKSVGFLYGAPGAGKSFISLDWALHTAFNRPDWHGDTIKAKPGACVIYIAGEGASGYKSRIAAWMHRHNVASDERGKFGLIYQSVNFMNGEDVLKLARTLRQAVKSPVALIVIDTVSRSMPGADENLQKEMTMFVKACDVVKDAFSCAVLGVHHANKQGDMRGSSVLLGAGDFVFKLERKKGSPIGRLHCEKQKDAPDGWGDAYRFDVVTLGEGRSSLVPARCEERMSDDATLTPETTQAVFSAIQAAWDAGEPWGRNYQSGERMAARKMTRDFGFTMDRAAEVLDIWFGSGALVEAVISRRDKRKGVKPADKSSWADVAESGGDAFD